MVSRLEGRCAEMKEYKGKIILTSMMTVMPIVVGLLLWESTSRYDCDTL